MTRTQNMRKHNCDCGDEATEFVMIFNHTCPYAFCRKCLEAETLSFTIISQEKYEKARVVSDLERKRLWFSQIMQDADVDMTLSCVSELLHKITIEGIMES